LAEGTGQGADGLATIGHSNRSGPTSKAAIQFSIPLVILTDSLGNEITQKTGYSERDMAALQKAIAVGLQ
jgi:CRISPR/Cas system type I-B associated protein Csh2 (Cas7 group RAMP superfamily)